MTTSDDDKIEPAKVAALYVEHVNDLRAFLIGVLRNSELADEALQATFAKTVEVGHTAQNETLKGWLFRVAFNEAMALRRRQKIHEKSIHKLAWSRPQQDELPDENLSRWEVVNQVRQAINLLPVEQQEIVRLRIYEEKKFSVIAEELNLPLGTVLTRMRSALRKLKNQFKNDK